MYGIKKQFVYFGSEALLFSIIKSVENIIFYLFLLIFQTKFDLANSDL